MNSTPVDNNLSTGNTLPKDDVGGEDAGWPVMPTETEIYLLPDGRVVIADMPIELTALVLELNNGLPEDE